MFDYARAVENHPELYVHHVCTRYKNDLGEHRENQD